jgi:hypothetical protein
MPISAKPITDTVTARLVAQAADQAALTGRAQSLLGAATIAATIVGALSNSNVLNVKTASSASRFPLWLLIVGGVALLLVVVPAIGALVPRAWQFSTDPGTFYANVLPFMNDPQATDDEATLSWVLGFLTPGADRKTPLDRNDEMIGRLRWFVTTETVGLACVIGFAFANVIYLSVVG